MKRYLFALLLPLPALAQEVGYPPTRSPYRDLEYRQELTGFAGYFAASRDPAGVAPQGGPMVGVRYEIRIAGPAQFTARLANVFSERTIIDPTKPAATRVVGTESWPLLLGDVGVTVNLTGQKSVRRLVPVLSTGLGVASDTKGGGDVGGYRFGTTFAFSLGGGVRWVPGGRFQLRADVHDYLYRIKYPSSYFEIPTGGSEPVITDAQSQSVWKHNAAITLGGSYLFFR